MLEGTNGIADFQCRQILGDDHYFRLAPTFPADKSIDQDEVDQIPYMVEFRRTARHHPRRIGSERIGKTHASLASRPSSTTWAAESSQSNRDRRQQRKNARLRRHARLTARTSSLPHWRARPGTHGAYSANEGAPMQQSYAEFLADHKAEHRSDLNRWCLVAGDAVQIAGVVAAYEHDGACRIVFAVGLGVATAGHLRDGNVPKSFNTVQRHPLWNLPRRPSDRQGSAHPSHITAARRGLGRLGMKTTITRVDYYATGSWPSSSHAR